ncbi:hypothetical protein BH20ACT16_BH20ACT16_00030 [soil metagenome]
MVRVRSAACCAALLIVLVTAGPAAAQLPSPGKSGGLPSNLPAITPSSS